MKPISITEIKADGTVEDKSGPPVPKKKARDLGLDSSEIEKRIREKQGTK